jgi:hypothetical protein
LALPPGRRAGKPARRPLRDAVTAGLLGEAEQSLGADSLPRRERVTSTVALYAVVI